MAEHPITPPPELVEQWVQATESNDCIGAFPTNFEKRICTMAARWGSDQELEACGAYLERCAQWEPEDIDELRAARRPKPPSLKEQALERCNDYIDPDGIIRRALEALDD